MYEGYRNIKVKVTDEVAIVYLNNPEKLNAINVPMRLELEDVMKKIAIDKNVRVVVITGMETQKAKEAFSSGDDLTDSGIDMSSPTVLSDAASVVSKIFDIFNLIDDFPKPVIAMVNGICAGGGLELALACDFIFCSENATFFFPEIDLGIIPSWGGTQRLPKRIGESKAKMLIMLGEPIDGKKAYEIGLADAVLPRDRLEEFTLNFARKLASKNPLVLMMAKNAIEKSLESSLRSGLYYELLSLLVSIKGGFLEEGVRRFFGRKMKKENA